MKAATIEWKILEWFDHLKSTWMNYLNQYISLIFGSLGLMIILMIIYWCVNKEKGKIIAGNLFVVMLFNNLIKGFVKRRRPYETHPELRKLTEKLDHATGSSFPSGHAMNSTALYGSLILNYRYKRFLPLHITGGVLIFIVCISRMYLGVHFPTDVLCGVIFGILVIFLYQFLQSIFIFNGYDYKEILYLITCLFFLPCLFIFKNNVAYFDRDFFRSYGLFLGFTAGVICEKKWVDFGTNVKWPYKLLRILIGGVLVGAIYLIYNLVPLKQSLIFTLFMHLLISYTAFFLVPLIFTKIEKGIRLKS